MRGKTKEERNLYQFQKLLVCFIPLITASGMIFFDIKRFSHHRLRLIQHIKMTKCDSSHQHIADRRRFDETCNDDPLRRIGGEAVIARPLLAPRSMAR